jgi:glycosyltransferase involved in cell wall biosynthesis
MISAAILTKNEEANIEPCLKPLSFCDDIVVIDDYSGDKTAQIAMDLGARVYKRRLNGNFAEQRNFALRQARGKWVLFVDADERVSRSLASEIVQLCNNPTLPFNGYFLRRHDFLWGKKLSHGEIGALKLLRLGKKGEGSWARRVHEIWKVKGETYTLTNPLLHYPHSTLREFLHDVNGMSSLDALAKKEEGTRASFIKIILWPPGKFFYNFVLRAGFLDGMAGFVVAIIMSFHSFLSWSKLWMLESKV